MYLLTIRDGLQTRHIGPYASPSEAAEDLDRLLAAGGLPCHRERPHWQIHQLESPASLAAAEASLSPVRAVAA